MAPDLLCPMSPMMLDLSWGTICGLYAMHYLARIPHATAQQIAEHGNLSVAFLAKTLQRLRQERLVRGRRGHGYTLARPAIEISVLEIVRALEGPIRPAHLCLMRNGQCMFQATCPLSRVCREVSASVLGALGGMTLVSLPVGELGLPVCMNRKSASP